MFAGLSPLKIILTGLVVLLVLGGCAVAQDATQDTTQDTTQDNPSGQALVHAVDRTDSDAVHVAWVRAIQTSHSSAALPLVALRGDEPARRSFAATHINEAAWQMSEEARHAWHGRLIGVDILATSTFGAGMRGYSRWIFENGEMCRYETLVFEDDQWWVEGWFITNNPEHCREAEG